LFKDSAFLEIFNAKWSKIFTESLSFMSYVLDLIPVMLRTIPSHGLLCVPALVAKHTVILMVQSLKTNSLENQTGLKIISIPPLQKH
jgi:hypothetical protein